MRGILSFTGLRRRYGSSPLHLVAHLGAFAIAAFALDRTVSGGDAKLLVAWYLAVIVGHDLIFLPVYCGLDRVARAALARLGPRRQTTVPVINHVRAPALISGLLLLIYAPLISGQAGAYYFVLTGHHLEHYLRNWLALSAALFAGSGAIYALRVRRARAAGRA